MKIAELLLKNILWVFIAVLIFIIFVKDCGGGQGSSVKTDTTQTVTIDTIYNEVKGSAKINPVPVDSSSIINDYLSHNKTSDTIKIKEQCNKPHLNDKGIDLIKHRNYKDTVSIKGYFISYDANVIGELQGINIFLNGNVPTIRQSSVRTVTTTIEKYNSLGVYANYNQTLQLGIEYKNKNLSYGINYDLDNKSLGAKIGFHPLNW